MSKTVREETVFSAVSGAVIPILIFSCLLGYWFLSAEEGIDALSPVAVQIILGVSMPALYLIVLTDRSTSKAAFAVCYFSVSAILILLAILHIGRTELISAADTVNIRRTVTVLTAENIVLLAVRLGSEMFRYVKRMRQSTEIVQK